MATASERRPGGGRAPESAGEAEALRARVRELEAQLSEARRVESLAGIACVAHDLNNVMAVITGVAELMLRRMDGASPLRPSAESIQRAALRGTSLVRSALAAGRVAGPPLPRSVDPNVVVDNVVRTLGPLLGDHVEVDVRLGRDIGRVSIDPGELEQVVMNLVLNARDAMRGTGRLDVETAEAVLDGRPAIRLRISDTGCGMDDATLARAFDPYFTTKPPGKGTGLGLATVAAIVTRHGGRVDAASTVGRGSTFAVDLPRVSEPSADAARTEPATSPTLVLVLENQAHVRQLIGEILEMQGYRVLFASDFQDALRVADAHAGGIRLLIADVMQPGVRDGRLLARLRAAFPDIRALYASGDLEDSLEEDARQPGWHGFLQKPFTVETLVRTVRDALGN